jgi:Fe-S cluster assembly protein SufD
MQAYEKNTWYRSVFDESEKKLNGESKSALHVSRREAMAEFDRTGFPTRKHEEWKFTDVGRIARSSFLPATAPHDLQISVEQIAGYSFGAKHRLVFVNGYFASTLSKLDELPSGLKAGSLATEFKALTSIAHQHFGKIAHAKENPFVALNSAFVRDGAFIHAEDNTEAEEVISILFIATGSEASMIVPRNLVIVGKNSRLSVVEMHVGIDANTSLTNAVTEVFVGERSFVEHDKLQNENPNASHVAATFVEQQQHSVLTSNSIALGGAFVRNNVTAVFAGERAECTLNGLSVTTGTQLIDNHTTIDHAQPNCASHELYKAILDSKSRGVFNGKVFVRKDAQKTDAKQTNQTLLLSDDATIDTKPQLEIFADDVKCTHGATVGQLDENQIFYLRSRGIDANEARDILTFAFAKDVASRIHVEAVREEVERLVFEKLHRGRSQQ